MKLSVPYIFESFAIWTGKRVFLFIIGEIMNSKLILYT